MTCFGGVGYIEARRIALTRVKSAGKGRVKDQMHLVTDMSAGYDLEGAHAGRIAGKVKGIMNEE